LRGWDFLRLDKMDLRDGFLFLFWDFCNRGGLFRLFFGGFGLGYFFGGRLARGCLLGGSFGSAHRK
jgi:hypothetical protein